MRTEDRKRYETECQTSNPTSNKKANLLAPQKVTLDSDAGQWVFPPVDSTQSTLIQDSSTNPPQSLPLSSDLFDFPSNAVSQDQFPVKPQDDTTQSLVLSTLLAPPKDQPQLIKEAEKLINENTEYEQSTESWFASPYTPPPPPPNPVPGCTNPQATNYNPNANVDDGSCVLPLPLTPQMSPSWTISTFPTAEQMIINQTIKSQQSPTVDSQDPDGIKWLTPQHWANSTWDGTPLDPTGMTNSQVCSWLRPAQNYVIRGIREKFYQVNPFQDNTNPTPAEIEAWNIEVIRHFRALFGNTRPVRNDPRLYLEARWADERKRTTTWDTQYPSTSYGTASGICWTTTGTPVDTAGGHCGEAFFPNSQDRAQAISQLPYQNNFQKYPDLTNYASEPRRSQAAGINSINADVPWSIKLSVIIANWICAEGFTAHPGPYVGTNARPTFGCSWWYTGGNTTSYRGKWR